LSTNIGCDQVSKSIVRQRIDYNEQISLLNDHLTLTEIENTGAFLGIDQSHAEPGKDFAAELLACSRVGTCTLFLLTNQKLTGMTRLQAGKVGESDVIGSTSSL
jgi:signal peptidase II